jgi:tRNA threonylcarbamoyladenosine biosynthesis protein TsaB
MILVIKTDSPETHIAIYNGANEIVSKVWNANRELSDQILIVINDLLQESKLSLKDLNGVVVYRGPGSYTGLRIGVSTANAIGYSYDIPVLGVTGENWLSDGLDNIKTMSGFQISKVEYGGEVFTTKPKK